MSPAATSPRIPIPSRHELAAHTVAVLNRGNTWNPDVLLVEIAGSRQVVKDFRPRSAFVRATAGRLVTHREARAWRALEGHPAVPRYLGRIDAHALVLEYRPGRHMSRRSAAYIPGDFVQRLEEALHEMHRRGVVHLDLRHRSNVLADAEGAPILIDFGSALSFRPGSLAARLLLPLLARLDLRALTKWRRKLAGYQRDEACTPHPTGHSVGGASSGSGRGARRPM